MNSLSNTNDASNDAKYKNVPIQSASEAPVNNNTACSNCGHRPVSARLSCKIYEDWCAFCNLSLLSTAPN